MDNSNFYVDLPSDASMTKYPANHGGEFSVDLPFSLNLSSHQWEVGLVEAIFTQEWSPIIVKDIWVQVCIDVGNGEFGMPGTANVNMENVSKTNVKDFEDVWENLFAPMFREALELSGVITKGKYNKGDVVKVVVDSTNKRIILNISPPSPRDSKNLRGIRLEMSQSLLRILGFTSSQLKDVPDAIKAFQSGSDSKRARFFFSNADGKIITPKSIFEPSLNRGISTLWIYSDIIKPHFTGHTLSPLLRIIAVDRKDEGRNDAGVRLVRFDTVDYFPLKYDDVSTIRVKITNQGGLETIQFSSPVIIKLHFRRRRVV